MAAEHLSSIQPEARTYSRRNVVRYGLLGTFTVACAGTAANYVSVNHDLEEIHEEAKSYQEFENSSPAVDPNITEEFVETAYAERNISRRESLTSYGLKASGILLGASAVNELFNAANKDK